MTDTAYFCVLSHEGVLAVRGPDACKFLQGQLTCNLNYLGGESSSLGARCTPKGRMQSSFRILQDGDDYLLAMAGDLLQAQQADLSKYAVFSKSRLSDESAEWYRFGLAGGDDLFGLMGVRDHANRHSGHAGFQLHPFGEGNLVARADRDFLIRVQATGGDINKIAFRFA